VLCMNSAHMENILVPCQLQKNDGGCLCLYPQAKSTCCEKMAVCKTSQPFIIFVPHSYGYALLPTPGPRLVPACGPPLGNSCSSHQLRNARHDPAFPPAASSSPQQALHVEQEAEGAVGHVWGHVVAGLTVAAL